MEFSPDFPLPSQFQTCLRGEGQAKYKRQETTAFFRAPIVLFTSWNLKTKKNARTHVVCQCEAKKNSNLICIQIEDVQINPQKTC